MGLVDMIPYDTMWWKRNRLGVTLESYESLPPLIGEGLSKMFRLKKAMLMLVFLVRYLYVVAS